MQSALGDSQSALQDTQPSTENDQPGLLTPAQVVPVAVQSSAVDSLMHALMSIGRLMRHRAANEDLDPGTFWLLKTLAAQGAMRVTDLATCASLDTSTVSRHVTQLHRSGLIERTPDPDDGRAQRVELSQEGLKKLHDSMDRRRTLLQHSFAGWDATDVEQLDRLLARFVGSMDNQNSDLELA
jgi:DNA-binding MarR family transcriptional regulator